MSMHDEGMPSPAPADKEKLIEEAAMAILWTSRGVEEPGVDWPADTQDAKRMAEVVLAVFERMLLNAWKAGAEQAWEQSGMNREYIRPWNRPDWDEEASRWYRDAGFLLPAVPAPSQDLMAVIEAAYNALHMETRARAVEILGAAIEADTLRELNAPKPQSEPSDALAAVDEALRLWNDGHGLYDGAWVARQAKNMAQTLQQARTALRAAGGVR